MQNYITWKGNVSILVIQYTLVDITTKHHLGRDPGPSWTEREAQWWQMGESVNKSIREPLTDGLCRGAWHTRELIWLGEKAMPGPFISAQIWQFPGSRGSIRQCFQPFWGGIRRIEEYVALMFLMCALMMKDLRNKKWAKDKSGIAECV